MDKPPSLLQQVRAANLCETDARAQLLAAYLDAYNLGKFRPERRYAFPYTQVRVGGRWVERHGLITPWCKHLHVAAALNAGDAEAVETWSDSRFHHTVLLALANALTDSYGVEVIRDGEGCNDDVYAEYCNTGDSYAITVVWEAEFDEFCLASWGDIEEERRAKRASEEEDDDPGMPDGEKDELDLPHNDPAAPFRSADY